MLKCQLKCMLLFSFGWCWNNFLNKHHGVVNKYTCWVSLVVANNVTPIRAYRICCNTCHFKGFAIGPCCMAVNACSVYWSVGNALIKRLRGREFAHLPVLLVPATA